MSDLRSSPHAGAQDHGGAPVPPELSMEWAQQLLAGYAADAVGAGGPILPHAGGGFMLGYLARNNPLEPQELDLAKSNRLPYRFYLYLRRQWTRPIQPGKRDVFFLAGANMSMRRQAVLDVGFIEGLWRFRHLVREAKVPGTHARPDGGP